jgi:hypothetical protein
MKKFTALMLVAICLVVGGVYATWAYAQKEIAPIGNLTATTGVQTAISAGEKGTLAIVGENTLALSITDNKKGTETVGPEEAGDYIAELTGTGTLVIKFTPAAAGADADVLANGVKLKLTLNATSNEYKTVQVLSAAETFTSPAVNAEAATGEIGKYEKQDDGSFTWTITGAEIAAQISLYNGTELKLATKGEYDTFKAAFKATVEMEVGEYVVPQQP